MPVAVLAALDISERLQDYGAYAGVASIVGLAVLSLLYFGQARELKRLREWAGREPERAAEREARAAEGLPPQRVAPQPGPAPGAVPVPAGARPRAAVPATAAGAASQAVKPAGAPGAPGAPPVPAAPANGGAAPAGPAGPPAPGTQPGKPAPATAAAGQTDGKPDEDAPAAEPGAAPAPGTPAPGTPAPAVGAPAGSTAAGAPGAVAGGTTPPPPRPRTTPSPSPAGAGPGPRTPAGAAAAAAARRREPEPAADAHPRRVPAIVAGIAGALLIAVLLVTVVFGGDDPANTPGNTFAAQTDTGVDLPSADQGGTTSTGANVPRGDLTVAVLNGTTSDGLAREAMDRIAGEGYKEGTTDNAPDRTLQATQVAYAEGFRRAAQDVARLIGGVAPANIVQLDRSTQVVAGEDAKVVVTLGADKA